MTLTCLALPPSLQSSAVVHFLFHSVSNGVLLYFIVEPKLCSYFRLMIQTHQHNTHFSVFSTLELENRQLQVKFLNCFFFGELEFIPVRDRDILNFVLPIN